MSTKTLQPKRLLRVRAAAEMLDISRSQAYKLIDNGTLATVRIGNSLRVPVEALEAIVSGGTKPEAA